MERKDYAQIMILFDPDGKNPLGEFCRELIREDNPEESELLKGWLESHKKEIAGEIDDEIFWQNCLHLSMGFAVGFVIGQTYEVGDEKVSAIVNDLKERILKARALPYFQRREKEKPQVTAQGQA